MTTSLIALIGGALGAVIAIAGAYLKGRRDAADRAAQRASEAYKDTRKRIDDADYIDDASNDALRSRLHERGNKR